MYLRLIIVLIALPIALLAFENKIIIAGTYYASSQAQKRVDHIHTLLLKKQLVSKENIGSLHFTTRAVERYYCSTIENFASQNQMNKVLKAVKKIVPDAYLSSKVTTKTKLLDFVDEVDLPETVEPSISTAVEETVDENQTEETFGVADEELTRTQENIADAVADGGDEPIESNIDETLVALEKDSTVTSLDHEEAVETSSFPWLYVAGGTLLAVILFLLFGRKKREPNKREHLKLDLDKRSDLDSKNTEPSKENLVDTKSDTDIKDDAEIQGDIDTKSDTDIKSDTEQMVAELVEPSVDDKQSSEHTISEPRVVVDRKKREFKQRGQTITKDDLKKFANNRILAADDNFINQKVLIKLFEDSGVELKMAENGQEVLDILNEDSGYSVVLMDAHMPIMDGFESARHIRADSRFDHITIVALSGDTASDDLKKMREAGMEEQLAKPLDVAKLYGILYQYLDFPDEVASLSVTDESVIGDQVLNHATGLNICANDEQMYREILQEFLDTYATSSSTTSDYLEHGDEIKLVALLLDIKGVAASIGADQLSEVAENFREVILVNEPDKYKRLQDEFALELDRAVEAIKSYL